MRIERLKILRDKIKDFHKKIENIYYSSEVDTHGDEGIGIRKAMECIEAASEYIDSRIYRKAEAEGTLEKHYPKDEDDEEDYLERL